MANFKSPLLPPKSPPLVPVPSLSRKPTTTTTTTTTTTRRRSSRDPTLTSPELAALGKPKSSSRRKSFVNQSGEGNQITTSGGKGGRNMSALQDDLFFGDYCFTCGAPLASNAPDSTSTAATTSGDKERPEGPYCSFECKVQDSPSFPLHYNSSDLDSPVSSGVPALVPSSRRRSGMSLNERGGSVCSTPPSSATSSPSPFGALGHRHSVHLLPIEEPSQLDLPPPLDVIGMAGQKPQSPNGPLNFNYAYALSAGSAPHPSQQSQSQTTQASASPSFFLRQGLQSPFSHMQNQNQGQNRRSSTTPSSPIVASIGSGSNNRTPTFAQPSQMTSLTQSPTPPANTVVGPLEALKFRRRSSAMREETLKPEMFMTEFLPPPPPPPPTAPATEPRGRRESMIDPADMQVPSLPVHHTKSEPAMSTRRQVQQIPIHNPPSSPSQAPPPFDSSRFEALPSRPTTRKLPPTLGCGRPGCSGTRPQPHSLLIDRQSDSNLRRASEPVTSTSVVSAEGEAWGSHRRSSKLAEDLLLGGSKPGSKSIRGSFVPQEDGWKPGRGAPTATPKANSEDRDEEAHNHSAFAGYLFSFLTSSESSGSGSGSANSLHSNGVGGQVSRPSAPRRPFSDDAVQSEERTPYYNGLGLANRSASADQLSSMNVQASASRNGTIKARKSSRGSSSIATAAAAAAGNAEQADGDPAPAPSGNGNGNGNGRSRPTKFVFGKGHGFTQASQKLFLSTEKLPGIERRATEPYTPVSPEKGRKGSMTIEKADQDLWTEGEKTPRRPRTAEAGMTLGGLGHRRAKSENIVLDLSNLPSAFPTPESSQQQTPESSKVPGEEAESPPRGRRGRSANPIPTADDPALPGDGRGRSRFREGSTRRSRSPERSRSRSRAGSGSRRRRPPSMTPVKVIPNPVEAEAADGSGDDADEEDVDVEEEERRRRSSRGRGKESAVDPPRSRRQSRNSAFVALN